MTKIWIDNDRIVAGMTLKDESKLEENNMALHSCNDEVNIIQNRKELAKEIGVSIGDFVCPTQTHSANFYKVTGADRGRGAMELKNAIPNTDALYTKEKNIVLCSFSADCVPIVFYHETEDIIGAIHSGWKGTVQEITRKMFQHLLEEELCAVEGFRIYIGAAICQEQFEVDEDVAEQYRALTYADDFILYDDKRKKYHIDNQATIVKQLELVGLNREQMIVDTTCTFLSDDGFSHRRDKGKGRHMAFIRRKK